jgi:solute carrier family 38 (sodium-coupled neutral amino acid transporter), member 9
MIEENSAEINIKIGELEQEKHLPSDLKEARIN